MFTKKNINDNSFVLTSILYRMSNIRERGVFIFRIGKAGLSGSVVEPDRPASPRETETGLSEVPDRCETTFDPCPQEADCEQYSIGFCCKCKEGYIGNGRQCIKLGKELINKIRNYN